MGRQFLMTMTGQKQGSIKGSNKGKQGDLDFSKGMECHGFDYGVITQIDPGSSGSTGKRMHKPITIIKELDAASPLLLQAAATNEVLTSVTFQFPPTGPDGKPFTVSKIELANATISKISVSTNSKGKQFETLILIYQGLRVNGTPNAIIPMSVQQWKPW